MAGLDYMVRKVRPVRCSRPPSMIEHGQAHGAVTLTLDPALELRPHTAVESGRAWSKTNVILACRVRPGGHSNLPSVHQRVRHQCLAQGMSRRSIELPAKAASPPSTATQKKPMNILGMSNVCHEFQMK